MNEGRDLKSTETGNVLFLILIAVALFAALSYAVTSSSRSGGGNASKEQGSANAAAIIQYATAMRIAITRMKLSNNCTDFNLDFSNSDITATNPDAPLDKSCHVFEASGGNMAVLRLPISATAGTINPPQPIIGQMQGVGTDGPAGTATANDLILRIDRLNKATCLAINDMLKINNPSGDAPPTVRSGSTSSIPTSSAYSSATLVFSTVPGEPGFCELSGGVYRYFSALIER